MTKARLFWHIFSTEKTLAIVEEQLRFIKRQPFHVTAVLTRESNLAYMDNAILNALQQSELIDIIKIEHPEEFEYDTLKILYAEAKKL